MKKKVIYLMTIIASLSLVSCDINEMMDVLNKGADIYIKVKNTRGETPLVTKVKNAEFTSSRGSGLTDNIKALNYTTYTGVDASFRDQVLESLKDKVDMTKIKEEVCTADKCVISVDNKGLLVFKQNGNNIDATAMKGEFSNELIQKSISDGSIYEVISMLK
jgi:hypothetical protein